MSVVSGVLIAAGARLIAPFWSNAVTKFGGDAWQTGGTLAGASAVAIFCGWATWNVMKGVQEVRRADYDGRRAIVVFSVVMAGWTACVGLGAGAVVLWLLFG